MPVSPKTAESQEQWRDVPGDPGLRVSNLGRKERHGTVIPTKGWVWVNGRGPTKIAVLVLEVFVGPCPPGMECCHYDDDPTNNTVSNLRWGTHQSNMQDRSRNGKSNSVKIRGEKHYCSKLTEERVRTARRLHTLDPNEWNSVTLTKMMGVSQHNMWKVINGLSWRHVV